MLEPRVRMLLRVQTRHCRHRARSEAVAVEYAHAAGAFYGPSGLGVEQVAIVLTFIVNPPRIVATRGDGCIRQLQSAEATGAVRVPNTHAPGCAVIAISDGGDIAASSINAEATLKPRIKLITLSAAYSLASPPRSISMPGVGKWRLDACHSILSQPTSWRADSIWVGSATVRSKVPGLSQRPRGDIKKPSRRIPQPASQVQQCPGFGVYLCEQAAPCTSVDHTHNALRPVAAITCLQRLQQGAHLPGDATEIQLFLGCSVDDEATGSAHALEVFL